MTSQLLYDVVALGKVGDELLLEDVDEDKVENDDEEGHDGRGHAGDGVAGAALVGLARRGEHGDEQGEPGGKFRE